MTNRLWLFVLLTTAICVGVVDDQAIAQTNQEHQSSLRLRQWREWQNARGQRYLMVNFGNYGDKAVSISGISTTNDGMFSSINQSVDPGAVFQWTMPIDREPAYITLDTNEGKFRFDLIPDR